MSFPFDLHSAAVSDSHLPCRGHAMLWPCRSSQGHGTARPSIDGLWATCPRLASSGNPTRSSTKIVIRSIPNLLTTIHTYDCKEWYQHTTKRTICYTVGLAVRIFPATTRTFTKDTALLEQGRGTAWYVWINARHGHDMLCVNPP